MSKAFTRESDDAPDVTPLRPQPSPLPPGTKNYVTPDGAHRLREEWNRLVNIERPRALSAPEEAPVRQQLPMLDRRIDYLRQSLESAVIVPAPPASEDRIRFGATVEVRDNRGDTETYRIVGVDETDIDQGWVSFLSPIAKALLNHRRGDRVRFKFPSGETHLEILSIRYENSENHP